VVREPRDHLPQAEPEHEAHEGEEHQQLDELAHRPIPLDHAVVDDLLEGVGGADQGGDRARGRDEEPDDPRPLPGQQRVHDRLLELGPGSSNPTDPSHSVVNLVHGEIDFCTGRGAAAGQTIR
jgi:hypothetical protein